MQTNDTLKIGFIELGSAAIGTIEARSHQQQRLDEMTQRLGRGEFHKQITNGVTIPARCVDGRSLKEGVHPLAPNAAGGSESLFVADDLTMHRFGNSHESTLSDYTKTLEALKEAGYEVGGHTDVHANAPMSGCGANDKLPQIYEYIARHGDTIKTVLGTLGVEVTDATHRLIVHNAGVRSEYSSGAALLKTLRAKAHNDFIDILDGVHNEVAAVINKHPGTTLDRQALKEVFGPEYQAFNVDVWSFAEAARVISLTPEEVAQKEIAMLYYNLATTFVLAGPKMRVIVLLK